MEGQIPDTGHLHGHGKFGMNFCPRCGTPLVSRTIDRAERRACPACAFIHWFDPKVACGCVPSIDGKVVLVRRAIEPSYGKWVFPGGYMDRGETVEMTARRETMEECCLEVELDGLLGVYSFTDSIVVVVVFDCRVVGGELQATAESLEVGLFAPAEIPWDDLAFSSTRLALEAWVKKHASEVQPA